MPVGPSKQLLAKVKPKPRQFSEQEQALRDYWNDQETSKDSINPVDAEGWDYGVPLPKHPGIFQPDPIINDPQLARDAENFFKIAPNLRGKSPRIMYGPGGPAISSLGQSNLRPESFSKSNLLGVTGARSREINLNPSLGLGLDSYYQNSPPDETLAHELTHASGYFNEADPEHAEVLARKVRGPGPSTETYQNYIGKFTSK